MGEEHLSPSEAVYFLTVTLSTVGFGDVVPTTRSGRIVMMFLMLLGNCTLLMGIGDLSRALEEGREKLLNKTQATMIKLGVGQATFEKQKKKTLSSGALLRDADEDVVRMANTVRKSIEANEAIAAAKAAGKHPPFHISTKGRHVLWIFFYLLSYACTFATMYVAVEGWTFIDALYFSVITATGVGYGDVVPVTQSGRWLCAFTLPSAVVFLNLLIAEVAYSVTDEGMANKIKNLLQADLSIEHLFDMDVDGDGEVTLYEFLRYALVQIGMVDVTTIDGLHARFQAMDADGSGALDYDDLVFMVNFSS